MGDENLSTEEDIEVQLTLRDRLNYPYLIAKQIETFQQAILNFDLSPDEISEAIEGFIHMIPASWRDDQFNEDMEEATLETEVDVRPSFAGVKIDIKTCIELGYPVTVKSQESDYYKLFWACINLLDRRGMLSKRRFTEKMDGKFKEKLKDATS